MAMVSMVLTMMMVVVVVVVMVMMMMMMTTMMMMMMMIMMVTPCTTEQTLNGTGRKERKGNTRGRPLLRREGVKEEELNLREEGRREEGATAGEGREGYWMVVERASGRREGGRDGEGQEVEMETFPRVLLLPFSSEHHCF